MLRSLNWKTTGELIAVAAVVSSLIFVGLELRQSQQIALAAQYQERTDSGRQYFYESLASNYKMEQLANDLVVRGWPAGFLTDDEKRWIDAHTPSEWAEAAYWAIIDLYGFDNYYFQYQSGYLTEEAWLPFQLRLQWLFPKEPVLPGTKLLLTDSGIERVLDS